MKFNLKIKSSKLFNKKIIIIYDIFFYAKNLHKFNALLHMKKAQLSTTNFHLFTQNNFSQHTFQ